MGQHLERATPDPVERQAARDGGGDGGTRRPECRPATVGAASGAVDGGAGDAHGTAARELGGVFRKVGANDDPWLGAHRREARAEGRVDVVRSILRSRGLTVSERLAARIAGEDPAVLAAVALACRDEADLLARLEARRRSSCPSSGSGSESSG